MAISKLTSLKSLFIVVFVNLVLFSVRDFSINAILLSALMYASITVLIIAWLKNHLLVAIVIACVNSLTFSAWYQYGKIDLGMFSAFMETTINESTELVGTIGLTQIFLTAFIFMLSVYSVWGLKKVKLKRMPATIVAAAFIALFLIKNPQPMFPKSYINQNLTVDVVYRSIDEVSERIPLFRLGWLAFNYERLQDFEPIVPDWEGATSLGGAKEINVIVIGESAVKAEFEFYQSNFQAQAKHLTGFTVYNGVISPSVTTRFSIPRILSMNNNCMAYAANYNLIDLANTVGYETHWISNQAKVGVFDSETSHIAQQVNYAYYLNNSFEDALPDNVILPHFKKAIEKNKNKKVIFLHTLGSHPDFCKRIEAKLTDEKACYAESIDYTVRFLLQVKEILRANGQSYNITYFSDHGMTRKDEPPYFTHGTGDNFSSEAVEVPFINISDDDSPFTIINVNYNLRNFIHTFAEMLNISSPKLNHAFSIRNVDITDPEYNVILQSDLACRKVNERKVYLVKRFPNYQ